MRAKSVLRPSALVAITVALLVGCGSSSKSSQSTTTKSKTSTSSTQTSSTSAPCPGLGTDQVTQAAPADVMYLTGITTGNVTCGDTVQFVFTSSVSEPPGYLIAYQNGPFKNAEDRLIAVAGSAFLVIRFEPASTVDLSSGQPKQTYTGSTSLKPTDRKFIRSVVQTSNFEGAMTWVIGLDQKRSFMAQPGANPSQVTLTIS